MTSAEVYDLLRARYCIHNEKLLFKNAVFKIIIWIYSTIRKESPSLSEKGKQIIFSSCTISNTRTKVPNYLHSTVECEKKCHIITHYKIHVHNHCNRFLLSEHISSFSLGALQPVSDFLITSTAEVFPLNPTAHCEERAVLCSLQRSQNVPAMATGAAPPMTGFDSYSFWLAVHSFHASLNVLGKTLNINCTIIHNCCHSLTDDWC